MSYGDYDLRTAVERFGLATEEEKDLFTRVQPAPLSDRLRADLDRWTADALAMNTEKARSEFIIAPILKEVAWSAGPDVRLFVGMNFEVDKSSGLTGICDYIFSRSSERYFIRAPILAVVEAKKEDISGGLGQCAAALVAARMLNEREGKPRPAVFGAVTTGNVWRFLKLEGERLSIDAIEYHIKDVTKILGILLAIAGS